MAKPKRLSHDDLLYVLFSVTYSIIDPELLTREPRPGPLAKQGFFWTTKYVKKYNEFFNIMDSQNPPKPDGHVQFDIGKIIITIEATTNPKKENLKRQIKFFCSNNYKKNITKSSEHEIWIFISKNIFNDFKKYYEEELATSKVEINVPVSIWTVDYHSQKYYFEKMLGTHCDFLKRLGSVL